MPSIRFQFPVLLYFKLIFSFSEMYINRQFQQHCEICEWHQSKIMDHTKIWIMIIILTLCHWFPHINLLLLLDNGQYGVTLLTWLADPVFILWTDPEEILRFRFEVVDGVWCVWHDVCLCPCLVIDSSHLDHVSSDPATAIIARSRPWKRQWLSTDIGCDGRADRRVGFVFEYKQKHDIDKSNLQFV